MFYSELAEILELESIAADDVLASVPTWDSLSMLTLIAHMDSKYGVRISAADLKPLKTAGDILALAKSKGAVI